MCLLSKGEKEVSTTRDKRVREEPSGNLGVLCEREGTAEGEASEEQSDLLRQRQGQEKHP